MARGLLSDAALSLLDAEAPMFLWRPLQDVMANCVVLMSGDTISAEEDDLLQRLLRAHCWRAAADSLIQRADPCHG